ncbi:MAG: hypothetical protein HY393_00050 [Candidatus Diapherotrites archaeon]|nr:hypothetical protein [Candidatus Diapherotrites archaeon]
MNKALCVFLLLVFFLSSAHAQLPPPIKDVQGVWHYSIDYKGPALMSNERPSPHFNVQEFGRQHSLQGLASAQQNALRNTKIIIDPKLVDALELLRLELNQREQSQVIGPSQEIFLLINSGYRNEAYNALIKGEENSQHIFGRAVDVRAVRKDGSVLPIETVFRAAETVGFGGLIAYADGHVHVDVRPESAGFVSKTETGAGFQPTFGALTGTRASYDVRLVEEYKEPPKPVQAVQPSPPEVSPEALNAYSDALMDGIKFKETGSGTGFQNFKESLAWNTPFLRGQVRTTGPYEINRETANTLLNRLTTEEKRALLNAAAGEDGYLQDVSASEKLSLDATDDLIRTEAGGRKAAELLVQSNDSYVDAYIAAAGHVPLSKGSLERFVVDASSYNQGVGKPLSAFEQWKLASVLEKRQVPGIGNPWAYGTLPAEDEHLFVDGVMGPRTKQALIDWAEASPEAGVTPADVEALYQNRSQVSAIAFANSKVGKALNAEYERLYGQPAFFGGFVQDAQTGPHAGYIKVLNYGLDAVSKKKFNPSITLARSPAEPSSVSSDSEKPESGGPETEEGGGIDKESLPEIVLGSCSETGPSPQPVSNPLVVEEGLSIPLCARIPAFQGFDKVKSFEVRVEKNGEVQPHSFTVGQVETLLALSTDRSIRLAFTGSSNPSLPALEMPALRVGSYAVSGVALDESTEVLAASKGLVNITVISAPPKTESASLLEALAWMDTRIAQYVFAWMGTK